MWILGVGRETSTVACHDFLRTMTRMDHKESYSVSRDGQLLGTYSETEVREGLASGQLLGTDHFWRQGMGQWTHLSEFKPSNAQAGSKRGKKFALVAVGATLAISLAVAMGASGTSKENHAPRSSTSGELPEHEITAEKKQARGAREQKAAKLRESLKACEGRIGAMLVKFTAREDKFQKLTWYTHRNEDALLTKLFGNSSGGMLLVRVNSLGGRYLTSVYSGKSWIFHTQVEFRIGENVCKTQEIPGKDNDRSMAGNKVVETCNYMSEENRNLCDVLARSAEGGNEIHYRLSGDHNTLEKTALAEEAEAIRDSVFLADALREREKLVHELEEASR